MTTIVAHRGYTSNGKIIENSIRSFENAMLSGAKMIEYDVHLTKDKEFFVFHDYKFYGYSIKKLSKTEIEKLAKKNNYPVCFLEDVITQFHFPMIIECKTNSNLAGKLLANRLANSEVLHKHFIASFFKNTLKGAREDYTDAQLVYNEPKPILQSWRRFHKKIGIQIVSAYNKIASDKFIAKVKNEDLLIFVWTVNNSKEIAKLLKNEIDGLITDNLSLALQIKDQYLTNQTNNHSPS